MLKKKKKPLVLASPFCGMARARFFYKRQSLAMFPKDLARRKVFCLFKQGQI